MTGRIVSLTALFGAALCGPLFGQGRVNVRTAVLFESYSLDSGLVFDKVSELTVPVVINYRLGRFGSVALSTGYVNVELQSAVEEDLLADQSISGLLDTEMRLSVNVVPGRLVVFGTGAMPTGTKTVRRNELSILGALASDIIGFSAATVGTGGNVGGGFAGAVPVGRFALGLGASYKQPFSYQPVAATDTLLQRGGELRARIGFEGPLARRTYLRLAGIYAMRQKDDVGGQPRHGVGNRIIGYLALSQGLGSRSSLTLYGFDVFRGDPLIEETAAGAALLQRGNLVALGARLALSLGRQTTITPRVEYRLSAIAADTVDTKLRRAGNTLRLGADFRRRLGRGIAFVLQAGGVFGSVVQAGEDLGLRGFRTGVHLELTP